MTENISLTAPDGTSFTTYIARPQGDPVGALVLVHEIWGLTAHTEDVADCFAAQGYLVAAPDILSHGGIEPALGTELFAIMNSDDEEARVAAQPQLREAMSGIRAPDYAAWAVGALTSVVDWIESQPGVDGRIGVVGFCFGGTYSFLLAASDSRIRAAVPFYGSAPAAEQMPGIRASVLALYGQHDPALIDALPDVRQAMAAAGVDFHDVVYPDAAHAFFNDAGKRYDAAAAADAWERVLVFLGSHLGD